MDEEKEGRERRSNEMNRRGRIMKIRETPRTNGVKGGRKMNN